MADSTASIRGVRATVDAIERRFCFAAWPQAFAHASWFDHLSDRLGCAVSRASSRAVGGAEQALAQALLIEAGADPQQRSHAIDTWPLWAMQAHAPMRHHLAIAGAFSLLPELVRAVGGDLASHWDAVLGVDVRRTALRLGQTHPRLHAALGSEQVRRYALAAARSSAEWDRFCLCLGLTALADRGIALQARVRLAWPRSLNDAEPWLDDAAMRLWLQTCLDAAARCPAAASAREVVA